MSQYEHDAHEEDQLDTQTLLEIAKGGVREAIELARDVEEENPTDLGLIIEEVAAAFEAGDLNTLRRYSCPANRFPYFVSLQLYLMELGR